jgi:hypothetical protein
MSDLLTAFVKNRFRRDPRRHQLICEHANMNFTQCSRGNCFSRTDKNTDEGLCSDWNTLPSAEWPTFFASGAHLVHEVLITIAGQDEAV